VATVSLPIGTPAVRGYLFHAYPLSILAGHGNAHLPWLYTSFVQLYQLPPWDLKFYLQPFSPGPDIRHAYVSTCPWLDIQSIDQSLVTRLVPLSTFLQHALDRGLYPQIDVDYGWLPDRPRSPSLHEILIHGYDGGRRLFSMTAYDGRGRFRPSLVSFDDLEGAAHAAGRQISGPRRAPDTALRLAPTGERPRVFLYRFVADAAFAFDAAAVGQQLWDYVDDANSSRRYRALAPPVDGRWGVAVYDGLVDQLLCLEKTADDAGVDIPLRILWEHKRLMAARVAFMVAGGLLDPDSRRQQRFQGVVDEALRLRLLLLRWRREPRADTLVTAVDILRDLAACELDLLGQVLHNLDDRCGAVVLPAAA
jgi:hypothetical protein